MSPQPWMNLAGWLGTEGLQILLIIVGSILLGRLAGAISRRFTNRITEGEESRDSLVRSEAAKHRYAVAQVLTYVVVALIVVVASVGVVERLGVSLTTLVAPATVLGAALGFGAQRIVQDFLAGFFVVTERHYGYGDVVEIWVSGSTQPAEGTVEDVTLRVTRLRTPDGEVITLPNGQITKTTNRSKDWARAVVDIPIPTEELGRRMKNSTICAASSMRMRRSAHCYWTSPLLLGCRNWERMKPFCGSSPAPCQENNSTYRG